MPAAIATEQASQGHLLRILGLWFGIAVALGSMIGAGILRAPSLIAHDVPDVRIILGLWVLGAIYVALQGNVLSELATAVPRAGGPYVYMHRAFGDVGGLAVGWTDWMAHVSATAALSVSFADFLALIWPAEAHATSATAAMVLMAIFGLNAIGLREGRALQESTSLLKAAALIAFCIAAVVLAVRLHPAARALPPIAPLIGWTGLIAAFQLIAGAYSGWIEPAYFSEENEDPGRSIPRAIGIGILVTAALYLSVNGVLLATLGIAGVAHSALPFTAVLSQVGGSAAGILFAVCAMVIVASCANASVMAAPRILLALSRDHLLPAPFRTVNKGGSPPVGFLLTAIVAIALATTGSFGIAFGLIATLNAAAGLLVIVAYFVLRRREPDLARPFRALAHPVLPALALAANILLFVLFLNADRLGALYAVIMWLLCIPFAIVARRARRTAPIPQQT